MLYSTAGINARNVLHCLWGSVSPTGHALDGVAVVSDIMASQDPYAAAKSLTTLIRGFYRSPYWTSVPAPHTRYTVESIKNGVGAILQAVRKHSPLVHQVHHVTSHKHMRIERILILTGRSLITSSRTNPPTQHSPSALHRLWRLLRRKWQT